MQNRLSESKSPYLLDHARNPIDWFPWGTEAFLRAMAEDRPILLSVGFSACHWCHVMARESFEDEETADIINRHFIPVKVDREERPDVDKLYMHACEMLTGGGGWPLHVFLTPAGKPFFAGTYFPPEDADGHMGFKTLLRNAARAWEENKAALVDSASKITDILCREEEGMYKETISRDAADEAAAALAGAFDTVHGGFGTAPKFPSPHTVLFLLAYGRKYANAESRMMAEKTLQKIRDGGLCDHVGGGYFRYSTDRAWHVPHYEKMLSDNALLAIAFLEAGGHFVAYAEEILAFLEETLSDAGGGYYAAVSAESEAGEGAFYLWDAEEVREVLGKEGKAFCRAFHITERSLPRREDPSGDYRSQLSALYAARLARPHPFIDRKILTGPNALAAVAFARAGEATGESAYTERAKKILAMIDRTLRKEDGRLLARFFDGEAGILAFLEDYAYLLWARLSLYEATGEEAYLTGAKETWGDIARLFLSERGGAFQNGRDAEQMIAPLLEADDGATPGANAVLALCLRKLYAITGDVGYRTDMEKIFFAFGGQVNTYPSAFCFLLYAKLLTE